MKFDATKSDKHKENYLILETFKADLKLDIKEN